MKCRKNKHNKAAFSLIEIMTVILIVAIGLVGTTHLVAQSLDAQMVNKGGIIASQLAQEGIEIVRQRRDTNWLQGIDWRDGINDGSYCVDYKTPLVLRNTNDFCPLHLDENKWYYAPAGAVNDASFSGYERVVKIVTQDEHSIIVQSAVRWNNRGRSLNYLVETHLHDWY